ncbi:MAG: MMPL family transporter [Chloroflexi bacterium]|nr:MAG: MMPL family transporter [Chloroflexota bacterium]
MFAAWGRFVHRRRWPVLAVSALLLVASGWTAASGAKLQSGGFIETSDSGRASRLIEHELPTAGGATFTLVFSSDRLTVTDAAFGDAVGEALRRLRQDPRVVTIVSPFDGSAADPSALISKDKHAAAVDVATKDELAVARDYYKELRAKVRSDRLTIAATGVLAITNGFNDVLQDDLRRAETVSLPLALVLLLIVFGSVVAGFIPLGVGILAVMSGIAGMFVLARFTDVSVYAENVVTLIGLGVAIDYSLFITNRYREELLRGRRSEDALAVAMSTAGRAITFSGLTVAIGLSGMLFYQGTYLSSMGVSGAIVVASAVFYGLTFLPALLAVLGKNVDRLRLPILQPDTEGRGWWHSIATGVMRRPVLVLVPVVAFILLAGSPFLHIHLATGDVTMLPKHEESRAAYDRLVDDFAGAGQNHISVVVDYPEGVTLDQARVAGLVELGKRLTAVRGVQRVQGAFALDPRLTADAYTALYAAPAESWPPQLRALAQGIGEQRLATIRRQTVGAHIVLFDVVTGDATNSDEARAIVREIRSLAPPSGGELLVTGFTAIDVDTVDFITAHTPVAIAFVMVATVIVLFLLLGSVVLPLKAVVMNLLSISASFGALVWVFQDGHLSQQLAFTPGPVDPSLPVIMFCTLFGLSMDYEVLLLSRIQEEYRRRPDNTHAVAMGLERSGRLITGAAAIMVGVFSAFALADILFIKAIGLGMALAVAIDATLVRALVVPATMRLLGDLNWWAPRPLARLYRRLGFAETASTPGLAAGAGDD